MVNEAVKFSVERLGLRFGEAIALDDVSLEIKANEILSIIGPSRSGKTSNQGPMPTMS